MKILVSNFGPTLMVGIKSSEGDSPGACERMVNQLYNFGFYTSDEYYDGYAVVESMDKLRDFLRWKAETEISLSKWNRGEVSSKLFAQTVDEYYEILNDKIEFTSAPNPRRGHKYKVTDNNDPADQPFD